MRSALFSLSALLLLFTAPVWAEPAPDEIVGSSLGPTKEALAGKPVTCTDPTPRQTKICRVLAYEYLSGERAPDGSPWGRVEESALVLETLGKKDLVLSAGVNWSIKRGKSDEPLQARFRYLSEKLEKTYGAPTAVAPPAALGGAAFTEGLVEYRQFTDGNTSVVLTLRKRGEGEKHKTSVSITFTDQSAYKKLPR